MFTLYLTGFLSKLYPLPVPKLLFLSLTYTFFFQFRKCPVLFFLGGFRFGFLTLDVFLVFLGLELYLSYLLPAYHPQTPSTRLQVPGGAEDDLELLYL